MSRPLRIEYPCAVYHITSRGNAKEKIYLDDQDRQLFLDLLHSVIKKYNWYCHAYCLMDNHYHLLIETPEGNLSRGMRQLNGMYTQKFNYRHNRVGHIFQGRYKAILVEKDAYLLTLCRYVVLNPVRAGYVEEVYKWKWSSYAATCGIAKTPEFLTTEWILGMFDNEKQKAQERYKNFVSEGIRKESPWKELKGQILLGSESFVAKFKEMMSNTEEIKEIPRKQRYANRPELDTIFLNKKVENKTEREIKIYQAHIQYGYTLKEIADYLGMHYTTVSKIVNRRGKAKTDISRPDPIC